MFNTFVGQPKIIAELTNIVRSLKASNESVNILFRGQAGCGKTLLAYLVLIELCKNDFSKQVASKQHNKFLFEPGLANLRGHFVDEVHEISDFTTIYPLMDSGKYIFVFATNEYGELPDAFLSRCIIMSFDKYTDDEIKLIILNYAKTKKIVISDEIAGLISSVSRGSPRKAKLIFSRLHFLLGNNYCKSNTKSIKAALKDIGVYQGGYTDLDIRYLQLLSKLKVASLLTLSRVLEIDKNTLINEIEPFLLSKGHILLTRSGRTFVSFEGV